MDPGYDLQSVTGNAVVSSQVLLTVSVLIACVVGGACLTYFQRKSLQADTFFKPRISDTRIKFIPQRLPIVEKIHDSPTSFILRVEFPKKNQASGLRAGQHILLYGKNPEERVETGKWNGVTDPVKVGDSIQRAYTPISPEDQKGTLDILIRHYPKTVEYPDGGRLTEGVLSKLEVGDMLEIAGPIGRHIYYGHGSFKGHEKKAKKIGLVAGGSGICPLFSVLQKSLNDPSDDTEFYLIYSARTIKDIAMRNMIEELWSHHQDKFHLWYTVDETHGEPWKYSVGYVNEEILRQHLPPPDDHTIIAICGPPAMIQKLLKPILKDKIGFKPENIITF